MHASVLIGRLIGPPTAGTPTVSPFTPRSSCIAYACRTHSASHKVALCVTNTVTKSVCRLDCRYTSSHFRHGHILWRRSNSALVGALGRVDFPFKVGHSNSLYLYDSLCTPTYAWIHDVHHSFWHGLCFDRCPCHHFGAGLYPSICMVPRHNRVGS